VRPGIGGLIYEGLNDGGMMALKVLPTSTAPSPSGNSTSTSSGVG
jgi:hypothetical protein